MATREKSYVCGTSDQPLHYRTIGDWFDEAADLWGDREALVVRHQDIRWTYRELAARVDAFAAGLLALGLEPGERIGIWAPNCAEWVITQYATAKAGLILVNINPAYRLTELEYALNKVGCRALITAARFKTSDYIAMLGELAPEIASCPPGQLTSAKLPSLEMVIQIGGQAAPGFLAFDDIPGRAGAEHEARLVEVGAVQQPDDAINIQFTSGTTGFPKGATLTHFNILNNAFFMGQRMDFTADDRLCIPVPLYHCFGMVIGNLVCMTTGACAIYPAEAFDPDSVLATVEAEKCTALHGVPTMFIAELDHPEFSKFDLASLRTGVMAGSPCPVEVMKRVIGEMHMEQVTIGYGMTETSPVSFQSHTDTNLDKKVSTVGLILPHVEAKVVDENGRIVPRGEKGELCTRGYLVMPGYWEDPEKTAEAIDQAGWMHTGDLAVIDEDAYCSIVGRVKDMVIRGGENIYPREIEEFLYSHPKIQDVQVFGVPDPKYGEELCAWIKLREGETAEPEDIRAYCDGQIAHFKIPRYISFVDEFPMTVTGKIQKFVMRERMTEELARSLEKTA